MNEVYLDNNNPILTSPDIFAPAFFGCKVSHSSLLTPSFNCLIGITTLPRKSSCFNVFLS